MKLCSRLLKVMIFILFSGVVMVCVMVSCLFSENSVFLWWLMVIVSMRCLNMLVVCCIRFLCFRVMGLKVFG